jgi:hypothetical protein
MVRAWERAAGCALLVCSAWVYGACEPAARPPTPRAEDAWSPPAAPASATTQLPTRAPSFLRARTVPAACEASLDPKGRLKVKEELGGLVLEKHDGGGWPSLASWPLDAGHVLVAVAPLDPPRPGAAHPQEGTLWRVSCEDAGHEVFLRREGASFGAAAPTLDGGKLYFSDAQGVGLLRLSDKQVEAVTTATRVEEPCEGAAHTGGTQRDVVVGLSANGQRLTFQRGAFCAPGGVWSARELVVDQPDDPEKRAVLAPTPVASVAVEPTTRTVWLADAGRCDLPGVQDPQTVGALWASTDQGQTWKQRPILEGGKPILTAPRLVLTDRARAGHMLVYTARCQRGEEILGGSVLRSTDHGRTWTRIGLPPNWRIRPEGQRLLGVAALEGDVDHLVIWISERERRETRDGGQTWENAEAAPLPSDQGRFAQLGRYLYRATREGLFRKDIVDHALDKVYPSEPGKTPPTVLEDAPPVEPPDAGHNDASDAPSSPSSAQPDTPDAAQEAGAP